MMNNEDVFSTLKVVKRNGKKVNFDETKIAIAIKKGFDSIVEDGEEKNYKYNEEDIQKVLQDVLNKITKEYADKEKIKIEEIQDLIEASLKANGYQDVYESFSEYRERRNQSREAFMDDKKTHKLHFLIFL